MKASLSLFVMGMTCFTSLSHAFTYSAKCSVLDSSYQKTSSSFVVTVNGENSKNFGYEISQVESTKFPTFPGINVKHFDEDDMILLSSVQGKASNLDVQWQGDRNARIYRQLNIRSAIRSKSSADIKLPKKNEVLTLHDRYFTSDEEQLKTYEEYLFQNGFVGKVELYKSEGSTFLEKRLMLIQCESLSDTKLL